MALCACGTKASAPTEAETEPIASCVRFESAFERCQSTLGAPEAAAQRVALTHETIHTQTVAAKTVEARAALESQCAAGVTQLASTCP